MLRIASLTLVVGAVLLLTWAIAATRPRQVEAPRASTGDLARSTALSDLEREIDRMRARLATRPDYPRPVRNPFQFAAASDAPRPAAAPAVVVAPPAPALPRLVAILSDTVDGLPVRRAALSVDGSVRIVGVGDLLGSLRVRAITPEGVELTDPATSATFRLSLR